MTALRLAFAPTAASRIALRPASRSILRLGCLRVGRFAHPGALRRARGGAWSSPARNISWKMMATATDAPAAEKKEETFQFQAEVSRVMQLIINSLYSNKEVFLRELVSNAADACDKRRFLTLSQGEASSDELKIRVRADKDAGTVTVEDTGVGMTKDELVKNLGSIATSGTSKFVEALGSGKADVSLIGQFGVGFYSSYLVADKVTVVTKSFTEKNAKQYRWESNAQDSYTIVEDDGDPIPTSGTRIILHIKDGSKEFLENFRLVTLMKRYSQFISFPIYGWEEKTEMEEVPDDSPAEDEEKEDESKEKDAKPKMKKVPKTIREWVQTNTQKPIWMRRPREVEEKDYKSFFNTTFREYTDPLAHTHFAAEGDVEFRSVLFTPGSLPFSLRQNMFDEKGRGIKLYVKRVFISETFEEIIPRWLSFIRGVVDSEDLPLNVSREILQQSRVLRIIKKRIIAKSLAMFKEISERDNDDYKKFWEEFGRYIKAGIAEDMDNLDPLAKLSRWASSKSGDGYVGLDEYVARMQPGQKQIYYIAAASRKAARSIPALEGLRKRDYEVLFMVEPVDEIAIQNLTVYKTKRKPDDAEPTEFKLVDINKENFKMDDIKSEDEKKMDTAAKEEYKDVVKYLSTLLGEKIGKVTVSDKLTESPSNIVLSQFGLSPTMERYMREVGAGNVTDPSVGGYLSKARILEINPTHPIINDLKSKLESAEGTTDDDAKQIAMLVYELALLTGGYPVDDAAVFAKRVASLVSSSVTPPTVTTPEKKEEKEEKDADKPVEPEIVE